MTGGPPVARAGRLEIGVGHEGDAELVRAGIASGEGGSHGRHACRAGQQAPDALHDPERELRPAAPGKARARVGKRVLAHAEHQAAAPHLRQHREQDGHRARPVDPDRVDAAEDAPERPRGSGERSQHGADVGGAGVVGEPDEGVGMGHRVVRSSRLGIQATEHRQLVDLAGEAEHEQREGAMDGERAVAVALIDRVLVGRKPHRARFTAAATARTGTP